MKLAEIQSMNLGSHSCAHHDLEGQTKLFCFFKSILSEIEACLHGEVTQRLTICEVFLPLPMPHWRPCGIHFQEIGFLSSFVRIPFLKPEIRHIPVMVISRSFPFLSTSQSIIQVMIPMIIMSIVEQCRKTEAKKRCIIIIVYSRRRFSASMVCYGVQRY